MEDENESFRYVGLSSKVLAYKKDEPFSYFELEINSNGVEEVSYGEEPESHKLAEDVLDEEVVAVEHLGGVYASLLSMFDFN